MRRSPLKAMARPITACDSFIRGMRGAMTRNLSDPWRLEKGDTVSPFWGRPFATVELSESHSSCGIRGLAKRGRLAPVLLGRLAQTVVTSNLG